jgi:hypothetical protein
VVRFSDVATLTLNIKFAGKRIITWWLILRDYKRTAEPHVLVDCYG